uniref:Sin3 histone deacetylase corepressor complex component SDS3 n=1 Tax=Anopheles atroparvus TaxID=41427 RepID=A0A182JAC4_ANOAO
MSSSVRGSQQEHTGGEGDKHYGEEDAHEENEYDSAEDTEEASENELGGSSMNQHTMDERMEIKEQMYQDKLANLMHQLDLLNQRKHPDYLRRVEKLQQEMEDRLLLNELHRDYMLACAERDCALEIEAAEKEYEEKKAELKENLISDLEDRKKMIEHEFATMELSGDSIDVKPTVTRKLRRRPNEPLPVPEKRRKPTTSQLVFLLDEKEVEQDLKAVLRGKPSHAGRSQQQHAVNGGAASSSAGSSGVNASSSAAGNSSGAGYSGGQSCGDQNGGSASDNTHASGSQTNQSTNAQQSSAQQQSSSSAHQHQQPLSETRIEDGKLWYERRWFHRGQPVYVEGKDIPRFSGNISAIGVEAICVKKTSDGQKVRIFLSHLRRGKVSIKRRAN